MNTVSMLRDQIGSLAGISSASGHNTWRQSEIDKGQRAHRYKGVPLDDQRRAAYATALAKAGVTRAEGSTLPALVTTKGALPESVVSKDSLGKLQDGDSVIDILGIPGESLPIERLESEGKATSLMLEDIIDTAIAKNYSTFTELTNDHAAIEALADKEHERWMQFNSYQKESQPDLFVAYSELPEAEKQKDRDRINVAITTFTNALQNLDAIAKVGL